MLACNGLNANGLFAIRQVAAQLVGTTDHRKVVVRERPIREVHIPYSIVLMVEY
jgi:hypothetical protein